MSSEEISKYIESLPAHWQVVQPIKMERRYDDGRDYDKPMFIRNDKKARIYFNKGEEGKYKFAIILNEEEGDCCGDFWEAIKIADEYVLKCVQRKKLLSWLALAPRVLMLSQAAEREGDSREEHIMFNKATLKRANKILEIANRMAEAIDEKNNSYQVRNRLEEISLHTAGYAEPGYTTESGIVATGNWNTISTYDRVHGHRDISNLPCRVSRLFSKLGIEAEVER